MNQIKKQNKYYHNNLLEIELYGNIIYVIFLSQLFLSLI